MKSVGRPPLAFAVVVLAATSLSVGGCASHRGASAAQLASVPAVHPSGVEVRFSVDMSLEMAWGKLDAARDLVVVRGGHPALGGWAGTGAVLTREGASPRFVGWARLDDPVAREIPYAFVVLRGGDPGDVVGESHTATRLLRVNGGEPDERPAGGDGYREITTPLVYFDHAEGWSPSDRLIGADLSSLPRLRSLGAVFSIGGDLVDPLAALRDHGFGLVRLRLWHTPEEPWHGLDATLAHAREAAEAGHELMLDIHYSDTWADPGHQMVPAAWRGLEFEALVDSVYAYTGAVVRRMDEQGTAPAYVQIGNEIPSGLLWDHGRVGGAWDTPEQWSALARLLSAGISAVNDALPADRRARTVVHVDDGANAELCRWFYDALAAEGVTFDAIGLSFYPWWHGSLAELKANLAMLTERYGKEVMVVETAYPWTLDGRGPGANFVASPDDLESGYEATPAGQTAFLRDLLATIEGAPSGLGKGLILWEPCLLPVEGGPPNPCENLTLFDFDGRALPALGFAVPWSAAARR